MKSIPHIGIEYPTYFPVQFEDFLVNGLKGRDLDLRIVKKEPTPWAATEWVIPGLIAVYLFKPYFESFLKEAGKDHYLLLKNKLCEILSKTKTMEVKTVTSGGATKKIDDYNTQSKAISIFIQTEKGIMIKLLFDNKLEVEIWHASTENFLNLIQEHYEKIDNPLSKYLNEIDDKRINTIYAIIDPDTKNWKYIKDLGQYIRENRNSSDSKVNI